jgi:hypothetical protein
MAHDRDKLEPLADGFVAFRTEAGGRWKHRDVEAGRTGPGYRLFVSDEGEERRYTFGAHEPHDATLFDLRDQLGKATLMARSTVDGVSRESSAGEADLR